MVVSNINFYKKKKGINFQPMQNYNHFPTGFPVKNYNNELKKVSNDAYFNKKIYIYLKLFNYKELILRSNKVFVLFKLKL